MILKMKTFSLLAGLLFTADLITANLSYAASSAPNTNPLVLHTFLSTTDLKPGAKVPVRIQLELDPAYHAYKEQFDLKVVQPEGATVSAFKLKPIVQFFDKVSKTTKEGIHENGDMLFDLTLPNSIAVGSQTAEFEVRFQACAADHCLFPKKIKTSASFQIQNVATNSTAASIVSSPASTSDWDIESLLQQKSWRAFLAVFFFGILTSFTPCIFPMIPITLSVIGARAVGQAKDAPTTSRFSFRGLTLSIFYVLGIALTYASLGLVAAKTGALFGSLLGNPIVITIIAIIFVVMGLSMYGLFELQAPAFIRDALGTKQTQADFGGAFLSGLIAGVVAGPCVGPVLVGVLTFVARTQSLFFGFWLLFTYALGMGLIFLVLGAFSGLLNSLPRSGRWMEGSKFIFGSSMIALAIYYLRPIISVRIYEALVALSLVLIASSYGAFESNANLTPIDRMRKGLMVLTLFVGLTFAAKATILENLTPTEQPSATSEMPTQKKPIPVTHSLPWKTYNASEFDKSRGSGQPTILDFSADWCQACKELEHYTYSDPRVQSEGSQFQFFLFDATTESATLTELRQQYGILGLPSILFFGKDGKLKSELTLTGFESAEQFVERMKRDEI